MGFGKSTRGKPLQVTVKIEEKEEKYKHTHVSVQGAFVPVTDRKPGLSKVRRHAFCQCLCACFSYVSGEEAKGEFQAKISTPVLV